MTLDRLLPELLLHIWTFLDDPASFARTCKRFQTVSKDTLWRAKWFLTRFEPYLALFEAIARPKVFTSQLCEQLLRLKAPLSRNLVQILHVAREPTLRAEREDYGWLRPKWGNISFSALATVIYHAGLKVSGVWWITARRSS